VRLEKEILVMIKFVHFFNYAEGVSIEDGEAWYLGEHVPRAKQLPGVKRYLSWKMVPIPDNVKQLQFLDTERFMRRSDLWFEDHAAWLEAYKANPGLWTPSQEGVPGFREFDCMLLDEEPQYNLLRNTPPEHYKYIGMPMIWRGGSAPEVEERDDFVIYSYWLFYRPDVSLLDAEDYYMGHHTREGKMMPGMKHYYTWKVIKVPAEANIPLPLNTYLRLTELGMPFETFWTTMLNPQVGIQFTGSPKGPVYGGPDNPESYHKMFHNPEGEDLLA